MAIADNNARGENNNLLCYLTADLKHFKSLTSGHCVIRGRKTFDSLPNGDLPNRKNIVISRNPELQIEGAVVVNSFEAALKDVGSDETAYVIGGAEIYKIGIEFADRLEITYIHHNFEKADIFFPEWDKSQWELVSQEDFKSDEKNHYDYSFVTYKKR